MISYRCNSFSYRFANQPKIQMKSSFSIIIFGKIKRVITFFHMKCFELIIKHVFAITVI